LSRIKANTEYLGDASTADWVSSGQPVSFQNNVLLTMAPDTVGTLLASTTYTWFGNIQATFKTSRGAGVVTAFILLSDVKDEIDYEFVGADLESAQSNYYFQGIPDCECPRRFTFHMDYTNLTQMITNSTSLFRTHLITITLTKSTGLLTPSPGKWTDKLAEQRSA
jgi:hypothetical protein